MNRKDILTRDLCDSLMQDHAALTDRSTEDAIASFRDELPKELRVRFNVVIDLINKADSEYMYEAFKRGMQYSAGKTE